MSDYTEHARLSPSGSKKWMACPGSITLEEAIPNVSSSYADEGTACHAVAAWCLTEHWRAEKRIGDDIPVHAHNEEPRFVEFTDEMAELVQEYVDEVRRSSIGNQYWVETRVEFSQYVGVPDQFGTADFMCYVADDKELQVDDAKFGHRPVGVEANSQLMFYALGAYSMLELSHDIERVRLRIHQPKVRKGPIEWTCTVAELMGFAKKAWDRAQLVELAKEKWQRIEMRAQDGEDPATIEHEAESWGKQFLNPNPNDEECAFCRAMALCPAAQRKVQEVVGADFEVIAEAPVESAKTIVPAPGFKLDLVMAACDFLEDFVLAVRAAMETHLLSGGESALFGLQLGREGRRRWSDPESALKMMRETFRLTIENSCNLKVKSPTQMEKLAGMDKASLAKKAKTAKPKKLKPGQEAPPPAEPAPPPVVGPGQWKKLSELVVRNPPKPSVKPKSQITEPYVPPHLNGDDFQPVADDGDDLA